MSILDDPTPPVPQVLTTKQKQIRYSAIAIGTTRNMFKLLKKVYADQIIAFWNNPNGLTPQECVDSMSHDEALEFLTRAAALKDFLNVQKAGSATNAPGTITPNADGSFTVTKG